MVILQTHHHTVPYILKVKLTVLLMLITIILHHNLNKHRNFNFTTLRNPAQLQPHHRGTPLIGPPPTEVVAGHEPGAQPSLCHLLLLL